MFIEITWKNSRGDLMKTLIPSEKVQSFVNSFIEREVTPSLAMPDNVVASQELVAQLQ